MNLQIGGSNPYDLVSGKPPHNSFFRHETYLSIVHNESNKNRENKTQIFRNTETNRTIHMRVKRSHRIQFPLKITFSCFIRQL